MLLSLERLKNRTCIHVLTITIFIKWHGIIVDFNENYFIFLIDDYY
jgi:hypothetical protein